MKKILAAALSLAIISAKAQTADDVINKYTANMGGLDAFNKIASVKITGTYTTQGQDFPLTTQIINGKGMRTDIDIMDQPVTNCYYDGKGWKVNAFAGAPSPTEVSGSELNELKTQSLLSSALMDYKARGHQVEMQGEETVDGIKTFKIKLTSKEDGKVVTYFVSVADYTLIKSVTIRPIRGQDTDVESFYSDLKDVGGVKFFMNRDSRIDGQVFQSFKYEKVELNATVDEKIFAMPK
ncbi:MAG: LolA family protein [Chitinophagaceae bacterium]